jgi:hypothetical protein
MTSRRYLSSARHSVASADAMQVYPPFSTAAAVSLISSRVCVSTSSQRLILIATSDYISSSTIRFSPGYASFCGSFLSSRCPSSNDFDSFYAAAFPCLDPLPCPPVGIGFGRRRALPPGLRLREVRRWKVGRLREKRRPCAIFDFKSREE